MKRVWKPLDINYLRLYKVKWTFPNRPDLMKYDIVAAQSPRQAAQIIRDIVKDCKWIDDVEPIIEGYPLRVYQPEFWNGAVVDPDTAIHPIFGKEKKAT